MQQRKPSYQKPAGSVTAATNNSGAGVKEGVTAPYNLAISVGDEMVRLTGLFQNKSKAGSDYLGGNLRTIELEKLVTALQAANPETVIKAFVFENKPKAKA